MKTVAVAVLKGGAGKSTITAALAWHVASLKKRVAMIDLNVDQDTLGNLWTMRGQPENPLLVDDYDDVETAQAQLAASGVDWLFLDSPPGAHDNLMAGAVSCADAVVIPLRASIPDMGAISETIELCQRLRKPFGMLLNAVDTRKPFEGAVAAVAARLEARGHHLFKQRISYHAAWINAPFKGKTGAETNKQCRDEIAALWGEVERMTEGAGQ